MTPEAFGGMGRLNELCNDGRMIWSAQVRGWIAEPDEIVDALSHDGFEECKRDIARNGRDRKPAGGMWQGLNSRTGVVASAIWISRTGISRAVVFIDIDGKPLEGR